VIRRDQITLRMAPADQHRRHPIRITDRFLPLRPTTIDIPDAIDHIVHRNDECIIAMARARSRAWPRATTHSRVFCRVRTRNQKMQKTVSECHSID